jgi:Flp pilus assembly CpaE family ATPase
VDVTGKKTLLVADEVVITCDARSGQSSEREKLLADFAKRARPNDASKLVLNQVGMPKRTEIKPDKFASTIRSNQSPVFHTINQVSAPLLPTRGR